MIFTATAEAQTQKTGTDGWLDLGDGRRVRCALGEAGVKPAADKREGDKASPIGVWPIRRVLWRPDKGPQPVTAIPSAPLAKDDGWCETPDHPDYNRQIKLPHPAAHETMWRDDDLYDLVLVLGHNDDPVVPGMGSAIFLHLARPGYTPTQGCVALAREDVEALLAAARPGDAVEIRGG
jgi:L,D-peptidoglycan transpeptidase YkuD (ErfK/YbiS/YcfS/YnhG family)